MCKAAICEWESRPLVRSQSYLAYNCHSKYKRLITRCCPPVIHLAAVLLIASGRCRTLWYVSVCSIFQSLLLSDLVQLHKACCVCSCCLVSLTNQTYIVILLSSEAALSPAKFLFYWSYHHLGFLILFLFQSEVRQFGVNCDEDRQL